MRLLALLLLPLLWQKAWCQEDEDDMEEPEEQMDDDEVDFEELDRQRNLKVVDRHLKWPFCRTQTLISSRPVPFETHFLATGGHSGALGMASTLPGAEKARR